MEAGEQAIGWTGDGKGIYAYRPSVPARVFRIELASGRRELWKELAPNNLSGVYFIRPPHIARDDKSYAYNYARILSDLYVVDGLKYNTQAGSQGINRSSFYSFPKTAPTPFFTQTLFFQSLRILSPHTNPLPPVPACESISNISEDQSHRFPSPSSQ